MNTAVSEYKSHYSDGQLHQHHYYNRKGKKHGVCINYYDNGKVWQIANYVNGLMEGICSSYHYYGEISTSAYMSNGYKCGECRNYPRDSPPICYFFDHTKDLTPRVKAIVSDINNITDEEKVILKLHFGSDFGFLD